MNFKVGLLVKAVLGLIEFDGVGNDALRVSNKANRTIDVPRFVRYISHEICPSPTGRLTQQLLKLSSH